MKLFPQTSKEWLESFKELFWGVFLTLLGAWFFYIFTRNFDQSTLTNIVPIAFISLILLSGTIRLLLGFYVISCGLWNSLIGHSENDADELSPKSNAQEQETYTISQWLRSIWHFFGGCLFFIVSLIVIEKARTGTLDYGMGGEDPIITWGLVSFSVLFSLVAFLDGTLKVFLGIKRWLSQSKTIG